MHCLKLVRYLVCMSGEAWSSMLRKNLNKCFVIPLILESHSKCWLLFVVRQVSDPYQRLRFPIQLVCRRKYFKVPKYRTYILAISEYSTTSDKNLHFFCANQCQKTILRTSKQKHWDSGSNYEFVLENFHLLAACCAWSKLPLRSLTSLWRFPIVSTLSRIWFSSSPIAWSFSFTIPSSQSALKKGLMLSYRYFEIKDRMKFIMDFDIINVILACSTQAWIIKSSLTWANEDCTYAQKRFYSVS